MLESEKIKLLKSQARVRELEFANQKESFQQRLNKEGSNSMENADSLESKLSKMSAENQRLREVNVRALRDNTKL